MTDKEYQEHLKTVVVSDFLIRYREAMQVIRDLLYEIKVNGLPKTEYWKLLNLLGRASGIYLMSEKQEHDFGLLEDRFFVEESERSIFDDFYPEESD